MARRSVSAVIVGAGLGGVAAAVQLKDRGVEDLTIVERNTRPGGVWAANTYPGLACDIPSHLYSFSFAPNPNWTRRYPAGDEIQAYVEDVVDRFDLRRHLRCGVEVTCATFDEARGRWRVELDTGEELEADVFAPACGQLSRPREAALPGLDRFAGEVFHSARWNHGVPLAGRRVAVVGTGASVIQIAPAIAPEVGRLTIFQRSAPWLLPKLDMELSQRTQRLYHRFPALQRAARAVYYREFEYLVPAFVGRPARTARRVAAQVRGISSLHRRIQLRGRPDLQAKATPDHPIGCKRILLSDDWYPTLRRDNVDLVTDPIREVVAEGVVTAGGTTHPADVLVLGTGFATTQFLVPMRVVGRGGVALSDAWREGAAAHLGITVPGFPNLFLIYGPHTNHGTGSILSVLESAARYIAEAVDLLQRETLDHVEVRREAHDAFQAELDERLADTVWTAGCGSWYVDEHGRVANNWPGTHDEYAERTATVRLADLVTVAPRPAPSQLGGADGGRQPTL